MPRLLIAKGRLPFPVESGTDAVSYSVLTALRDTWDVTIVSAASGARAQTGAEALRREGFEVVLAAAHRDITDRHPLWGKVWTNASRLVAGIPRSHWVDAWPALGPTLTRLTRERDYDLAQLEYWTLGRYARAANCPVALLNHDVWFRTAEHLGTLGRSARQRVVWRMEARATRRHELRAQQGADLRLYLTEADRDLADRALGDGSRSAVLPVSFPYAPRDPAPPGAVGPTVVFLGVLGALFNQDAAEHLALRIWPGVLERVPEAQLVIAGPGAPGWLQAYSSRPRIRVSGFVPDPAPLYRSASLAVAPVRVGTGIKVKVAHALSFGVPVAGSAAGLAGYPPSDGLLPAESPSAMTAAIVRLLENSEEQRRRALAASAFYRSELWVGSIGRRVESFYRRAIEESPTPETGLEAPSGPRLATNG